MMLDWNQYREQLLKAIGDLGRLSPQTVRGYRECGFRDERGRHRNGRCSSCVAGPVAVRFDPWQRAAPR